ncbi:MAG: hypothetical protein GY842_06215 [bacterium]|nr:hypothetical protein [bacterium]
MIVWGGEDGSSSVNTGGRYDPNSDAWTETATTDAPSARREHAAVWTGSQMLVWGGNGPTGYLNTGGRYDPVADEWTPITTVDAPDQRSQCTVVWTGSKMIVWGGNNGTSRLNTGGCYDPVSDTWIATTATGAPDARWYHTAVWTGAQMLIWGGTNSGAFDETGGRYDPDMNSWTPITNAGAPSARWYHTAIWSGSEMFVWGGTDGAYPTTGGRYDPDLDAWSATETTGAPSGRRDHTVAWNGAQMFIWGGNGGDYLGTGSWLGIEPVPPLATTEEATDITDANATLNATINPNGALTTVFFEYGPTTEYGLWVMGPQVVGSSNITVSKATWTLTPGMTYHYRVLATRPDASTFGDDMTFTAEMDVLTVYTLGDTTIDVTHGDNVFMQVHVSGADGPEHYAWYFEDGTKTEISVGDDSDTLFLTDLQVEQSGTYFCDVEDDFTTVRSANFVLTVNPTVPAAGVGALSLLAAGTALAGALGLRRRDGR